MLENQRDKLATKAWKKSLRAQGLKPDQRSYITFAGHIYLAGADRSRRREEVFAEQKSCQMCGKHHRPNQGELDHIVGGRPVARCDCWRTVLADGTTHTNLQRICGRYDIPPCHTMKHHREVRFGKAGL